MPVIASAFRPAPWLHNGHVQTILPVLLPRRVRVTFARERLELADGDFLDLDWAKARMIAPDRYEGAIRITRRRSALPPARFADFIAAYERPQK